MNLDFKDITLSSEELINGYIKQWNCENAEFSFAHMYIWGCDGEIQYSEGDGCLYIKLDFAGEDTFFWPPFPKDEKTDYRKALLDACEYMKNNGIKPVFRSVAAPFDEMMRKACPELELVPNRKNFDYIYLSESLITLKGKKLHGKRNHINKLLREHPDFVYENLTKDHYEECMAVYDEWCMDHKEITITQYDERSSVERALLNLEDLGLTGGAIRIGGVIKAFTVGEKTLPHMSQIHIEKAAKDIDGLYPLINQKYAEANCADTTYINREEDMGLEGLRKAKQSYNPYKMTEKYDAALKCSRELEEIKTQDLEVFEPAGCLK